MIRKGPACLQKNGYKICKEPMETKINLSLTEPIEKKINLSLTEPLEKKINPSITEPIEKMSQ